MSIPPNASTRLGDESFEIGCAREVTGDGEAPDPRRLALDDLGAPREHRDVRALGGEPLGDREAHPLGCAEHDCGSSAEGRDPSAGKPTRRDCSGFAKARARRR